MVEVGHTIHTHTYIQIDDDGEFREYSNTAAIETINKCADYIINIPSSTEMSMHRHCKREAKLEKAIKKQQQPFFTKKEVEQELRNLEEDRYDSQTQDPILKRAIRWWQRLDEKYFQTLTIQDAIIKRDICTSNQVLTIVDNETSAMLDYKSEMFTEVLQSFTDKSKIRVLFHTQQPYQLAAAVYAVEPAIANYHSEACETLDGEGIKVESMVIKSGSMLPQHSYNSYNPSDCKSMRLSLQDYDLNESPLYLCDKMLKIQQISCSSLYLNQVDKQIALWEWELQRVNQQNCINWNKLISNMQADQGQLKVREMDHFDQRIEKYRDKIFWAAVVRSFEHGFRDKTRKMLEMYIENEKNFSMRPPKGLIGHGNKKFFETDCKICFSSDNNDYNQVLYCDSCNTSFHLLCYGLTSVPQQQIYYCERCTYMKKQQSLNPNVKLKKPFCQICLKTSFPMKRLDEHFYHVTCLVLFNFVQFRHNTMVLRGSLSHENIIKMVIQNQLLHEECNQCRKIGGGTELGMQIKCYYQGCNNFTHPICAYLNGHKFELKSNPTKNLQVKMFCNNHLGPRVEQVYLRRYMCNLNDTSTKSLDQFKSIFEAQQQALQSIKESLAKARKKYPNRILMSTKFIKNLMRSRMEKEEQDQIQTETQAILRKLKNKNKNSLGMEPSQ